MVQVTLTREYALPAAAALSSVFLLCWMTMKVVKSRKAANVPYPFVYASRQQCGVASTIHDDAVNNDNDKDKNKDKANDSMHVPSLSIANKTDAQKKAIIFNCTQRAHQNTLEAMPIFLTLLALASVQYPTIAGASGLTFVVGRALYMNGYATGEPKKRGVGAMIDHLGLLALLGTACWSVYGLAVYADE